MDADMFENPRERVKIVECPRDAWQSLTIQIPAGVKAAYLNRLIDAGFKHIDAVSFVSPHAVPQMIDSEEVLRLLPVGNDVEIIGIVVNVKGAERAIQTGKVHTLGFPYSISPTFLKRNQNQTPEDSLATLKDIASMADSTGLDVVAYISMAFGNPYGDAWTAEQIVHTFDLLSQRGVRYISLADTVGLASPAQIAEVYSTVIDVHPAIEVGVHLHARSDGAAKLIEAAYTAGCRRFDGAIGGLGGCPFAQDDLVGNLPTEVLIAVLQSMGADLPELNLERDLLFASQKIAETYGTTAF